jgi:hypothetical protein
MKKSIILMFLTIVVFSCSIFNNFNKNTDMGEKDSIIIREMNFDENEYENFIQKYYNEDEGIVFNIIEESEMDGYNAEGQKRIIEKEFSNEISDKKIYYIGAEYRGEGIFWICNNGIRKKILETPIRYGPKIIWHGKYIVEIKIPTGSPFSHSYYFNFLDNKLSRPYNFPIYYDIENETILIWGNSDFELYDLNTDELIRDYYFRRITNITAFWPYIKYYIIKQNDQILLFYDDDTNNRQGYFIIDIRNKNKINVA